MLDFLKEHTHALHNEVEALSLANDILNHSISESSFEEFLIRNYFAYRTVEEKLLGSKNIISQCLHELIDSEKSDNLLNDIKTPISLLGTYKEANFCIFSGAEAIGALYVLEGSMLGSNLISKHLRKCPKLNSKQRPYFFNIDTKSIIQRWKLFSATISQLSFTENEKEEALLGARKTFLVFKQCYTMDLETTHSVSPRY